MSTLSIIHDSFPFHRLICIASLSVGTVTVPDWKNAAQKSVACNDEHHRLSGCARHEWDSDPEKTGRKEAHSADGLRNDQRRNQVHKFGQSVKKGHYRDHDAAF